MKILMAFVLLVLGFMCFYVACFISFSEGMQKVLKEIRKLYGEDTYREILSRLHDEVNKEEENYE